MSVESEVSALYPPPPPYFKLFTSENVEKLIELRETGVTDDTIRETVDLKFLIPPIQPDKKQYRSFGDLWWFEDKQVGLKESGVEQIYGDSTPIQDKDDGVTNAPKQSEDKLEGNDEEEEVFSEFRINELKKMTKSLLLNFLELVGMLAKNPSLAAKKIDHIRTILINIHHLLNSYRLHQSRETLILTMQHKLDETKEEIISIKDTCASVKLKLDLVASKLRNVYESNNQNANDQNTMGSTVKPSPNLNDYRKEALVSLLQ